MLEKYLSQQIQRLWICVAAGGLAKTGPTAAAYISPFPAFNWKVQGYLKTKLLPKNEVTNK